MKKLQKWAGVGLFVLGAALFVLGRMNAEHTVVLRKAVTICLECIGIG